VAYILINCKHVYSLKNNGNKWSKMDNIKLEKLFNENKDDLQRFINSKVHNSDLAKDLSQDTFIKLITTLRKENYNEEGKFLSYAFAVAHNVIRDHYRKNKPVMVRSDNHKVFSKLESKQLNKEEQIIKNQIIDLVKDCIDDLPYKFKEVVKLRIYNQLTFKDISKQLDVKINTVQGRFRYGLRDLKESHGLKQILNR
jgi:RNA polymerase sigma factor (sigma-70 family)